MIDVKIKRKDENIVSVETSGHAGYAFSGKDIVCAAVSAIVQTALIGLKKFSSCEVEYTVDEAKGYLYFSVPTPKSETERIQQQATLYAMQLGLQDVEMGYKAYLKVEVK